MIMCIICKGAINSNITPVVHGITLFLISTVIILSKHSGHTIEIGEELGKSLH